VILKKFLLLFFCFMFIINFFSCSNQNFSQSAYLEINLNEPRRHGFSVTQNQPLEIFQVIEKAASDDNIRGIILNIGSFNGDRDYLWEIRSALEKFKSGGKKIVAFFSFADMDSYLLASVADQIVMDELGMLNITGYSMGRGYVKNMLEKLGIGVKELRYFEYKSAGEMYTRDSFSEADKKQYSDYLDDIFHFSKDILMKARNWTDEDFNDVINKEFLYSAKNALSRNLIDHIGRSDVVLDVINEIEETVINNFVLFGNSSNSLTNASGNYSASRGSGGSPIIAVVYAEGQTDMEMGMAALNLSNIIKNLADTKKVAAIVLRINSPGGSAEAADYINEAVRYARLFKPVVVSMGSVAASGGYWAAMNASHIVCNPYTITGSIGVIASWLYDDGFSSKIGFNTDVIKRGDHSDLYTGFLVPYRNLTALEEDRYKQNILDLYSTFTKKVTIGRVMDINDVEAAAQGRIFSGIRALEIGLVDSIGGLSDAITVARNIADIDDNKRLNFRKYPQPTFMEKLLQNLSSVSGGKQIKTENILIDLILPDTDIQYRIIKSGQVMPILPLDTY